MLSKYVYVLAIADDSTSHDRKMVPQKDDPQPSSSTTLRVDLKVIHPDQAYEVIPILRAQLPLSPVMENFFSIPADVLPDEKCEKQASFPQHMEGLAKTAEQALAETKQRPLIVPFSAYAAKALARYLNSQTPEENSLLSNEVYGAVEKQCLNHLQKQNIPIRCHQEILKLCHELGVQRTEHVVFTSWAADPNWANDLDNKSLQQIAQQFDISPQLLQLIQETGCHDIVESSWR